MNENLTELVCIIDRSTSIRTNNMIDSTIEGFNALVAKQKEEPGEAKMTLILFDGDRMSPDSAYEVRHDGVDIHSVFELNGDNFRPKGMTALYDSIGRTIDRVKNRIANTPDAERPAKIIVTIITDGEENSSVEYTKESVKTLIESMEKDFNWTFLFLGAGIDAMQSGISLGISVANTMSFDSTSTSTAATYRKMSHTMSSARGMSVSSYVSNHDTLLSDAMETLPDEDNVTPPDNN